MTLINLTNLTNALNDRLGGHAATLHTANDAIREDHIRIALSDNVSAIVRLSQIRSFEAIGCATVSQIVDAILESIDTDTPDPDDITKRLSDLESIRSNLIIRPVPLDKATLRYADCVYQTVGDIALVVILQLADSPSGRFDCPFRKNLLPLLGLSADDTYDLALRNTQSLSPARVVDIANLLTDFNNPGLDCLAPDYVPSRSVTGNCLTNTTKTYGAVVAFYSGLLDRFATSLQSDLYVAFTSCHEAMVHTTADVDPDVLRTVLRETIREATAPDDYLSDHVYMYTRSDHSMRIVA